MNSNNNLDRRKFLKLSAVTGLSAMIAPKLLLADDCDLTTSDIQGPFFSAGSPTTNVLADTSEPGTRLFISGKVYADDCITPVQGAIVDVWQANDSGCYSVFEQCTPASTNPYNLRGQMLTDAQGNYGFESIKPGFYLNGANFRPAHIHFRVVTPDNTILVTQLYFQNDPYISIDPWASDPSAAERIIPLTTQGDDLYGTFDIKMNTMATVGINDEELKPDFFVLHQNYPNPFNPETTIRYSLPLTSKVKLIVFNEMGKTVAVLENGTKSSGYHNAAWNGKDSKGRKSANGLYFYKIEVENEKGKFSQTQKMMLLK
ncbi:MAG: T9SS C-terminal target domain-containing protein [Calditrichaeota bacterium]|nr:MAG: T9SS C-terminal target domain-containing protein [Calditrichota bacterium]